MAGTLNLNTILGGAGNVEPIYIDGDLIVRGEFSPTTSVAVGALNFSVTDGKILSATSAGRVGISGGPDVTDADSGVMQVYGVTHATTGLRGAVLITGANIATGSIELATHHATPAIKISLNSVLKWSFLGGTGHLVPATTNTVNIGSTTVRVQNIYAIDAHVTSHLYFVGVDFQLRGATGGGDATSLRLGGGSDVQAAQGATLLLFGNTYSGSGGAVQLRGGQNATGHVHLITNDAAATVRFLLNNSYKLEIGPAGDFLPVTTNTVSVGSASREVKDIFVDGIIQTDALRIDQTPTAASGAGVGTTKMNGATSRNNDGWVSISANGTTVWIPTWTVITG